MKDSRISRLRQAVAEPAAPYGPLRITELRIAHYRYFTEPCAIDIDGKNLLVYGENGSGKSSIYRALAYLTRLRFDSIDKERNIFCPDDSAQIEFFFSNGQTLVVDRDLGELPDSCSFLRGLSVFSPMLDYKKLLRIHYAPGMNGDQINIYGMLRELFRDYRIPGGDKLSGINDFTRYFDTLKAVVNGDLLLEINTLIAFFDKDFRINRFFFRIDTSDDGRPEPRVSIDIDYRDTAIEGYHLFLNEARLSALAISVYFASIHKLLGTLDQDCLKILALDDLLISLDMGNRMKLMEILKDYFADFQIFFFTHDKSLFNLYKNQLDWRKYEIYAGEDQGIPRPILKAYESRIQKAKTYLAKNELDSAALQLRKEFENLLQSLLQPEEQRDRSGRELDLSKLIARAKKKVKPSARGILTRLDRDRQHILNPLCHGDKRPVFAEEIRSTIEDLDFLINFLK